MIVSSDPYISSSSQTTCFFPPNVIYRSHWPLLLIVLHEYFFFIFIFWKNSYLAERNRCPVSIRIKCNLDFIQSPMNWCRENFLPLFRKMHHQAKAEWLWLWLMRTNEKVTTTLTNENGFKSLTGYHFQLIGAEKISYTLARNDWWWKLRKNHSDKWKCIQKFDRFHISNFLSWDSRQNYESEVILFLNSLMFCRSNWMWIHVASHKTFCFFLFSLPETKRKYVSKVIPNLYVPNSNFPCIW